MPYYYYAPGAFSPSLPQSGVEGFAILYEILGLPPRKLATKEQIRRAYRLMTLKYHPDKVRAKTRTLPPCATHARVFRRPADWGGWLPLLRYPRVNPSSGSALPLPALPGKGVSSHPSPHYECIVLGGVRGVHSPWPVYFCEWFLSGWIREVHSLWQGLLPPCPFHPPCCCCSTLLPPV